MSRLILNASEGKVLTDGQIYGVKIYLADGRSADEFYEVTVEEYEEFLALIDELME